MTASTPAGAPWGASAADWRHFQRLGLGPDLLPVVSDPTAVISPLSKMRDLGKTPSRFNGDGHAVGIPAWTQLRATERQIKAWAVDTRLGICLQTRAVKAIDIDIADPVRAGEVESLLALALGQLPARRRSNSGKRLLVFRLALDFPKRVIRTPHGIIELLSTGQQFIAVGTHPSGARYEWDGGLPGEIPALTMAEVDVAWQALAEQFALPDGVAEARAGMVPTRPRTASDTTDPTVAWLAENGWVTEYQRDGRVDVRCPWEQEHTSDSGKSSTSWFPAGVGGFAQGHFRCLHAHCVARTDGDFLEATGYTASAFDVVAPVANATVQGPDGTVVAEPPPLPPFLRNRLGQPIATLRNAAMAARRPDVCNLRIAFDAFRGEMLVGPARGGEWRALEDNDISVMRDHLEGKNFEPPGKEVMRDAIAMVAYENRFDSAIDWLKRQEWDGVERVETFFESYYGVQASPYAKAVALYTWTALAGRCLEPGVKADMAPVLIGLQGAGKTTAIEALSPVESAFTEIDLEKKDDDLARQIRGKLVGELAELRGLQSRDAEAIKAWVSRRAEEWTPKYREFITRYQRRLVLFGTGNKDGFLDDETGERRWLPMHVGQVDVARIVADRAQLWAEGAHLFAKHGVMWQGAYTLAPAEHVKFKVGDPWLEPIREWLERSDMDGPRSSKWVRMHDILTSCLGLSLQKITRKEELRVGKVLPLLGFKKGNRRIDGVLVKVWERAENSTLHEGAENSAFADLA